MTALPIAISFPLAVVLLIISVPISIINFAIIVFLLIVKAILAKG